MHIWSEVKSLSRVPLFVTPWTVAYQAPPSLGFSSQGILEWVAISFSRRSSQPRDWTQVSHIVGRSFTVSLEEDGKCLCCSVVENALEVKWSRSVMSNSFFFFHVQLVASPWTVAHYAPLSMGFSRQEYWSGLPFPSPGDLPNPGIETRSPTL